MLQFNYMLLDIISFMKDYSLKMVLSGLLGAVFATVFIILALVVPLDKPKYAKSKAHPKNKLGKISESFGKR